MICAIMIGFQKSRDKKVLHVLKMKLMLLFSIGKLNVDPEGSAPSSIFQCQRGLIPEALVLKLLAIDVANS